MTFSEATATAGALASLAIACGSPSTRLAIHEQDGACGGSTACSAQDVCAGLRCSCLAQVEAVYDSTPLVRRVDGTVWVLDASSTFVEVPGPWTATGASGIAASGSSDYGTAIGCALSSGRVWCFPLGPSVLDSTDLGAGLGPGTTTTSAVLVATSVAPLVSLAGAVQIEGGMNGAGATFCAVTDKSGVYCWGYNVDGILGDGATSDSNVARDVMIDATTPLSGALEVRVGYSSACARKTDGTVWCWGDNSLGQLGVAPSLTPASLFAVQVPGLVAATRLAANPGNTHCAIGQSTGVTCWGWNEFAQTGAPISATAGPTAVSLSQGGPPLVGAIDLAPDFRMQAVCARTSAALTCWGNAIQTNGARGVSPYPAAIADVATGASLPAPLLPLASYGGVDGSLVYVDPAGALALGAGAPAFGVQPGCP